MRLQYAAAEILDLIVGDARRLEYLSKALVVANYGVALGVDGA